MLLVLTFDTPEEKRTFEILYEKYRKIMMQAAYDILQDKYLAEDAVQTAFIKIADKLDRITQLESYQTKRYVIITARNAAIDLYRRRKKMMGNEVSLDEIIVERKRVLDLPEEAGDLSDRMEKLPEIYKDVLFLKYADGYDNKEIAGILDISEDNVRQRLSRGKHLLNQLMGESYE